MFGGSDSRETAFGAKGEKGRRGMCVREKESVGVCVCLCVFELILIGLIDLVFHLFVSKLAFLVSILE